MSQSSNPTSIPELLATIKPFAENTTSTFPVVPIDLSRLNYFWIPRPWDKKAAFRWRSKVLYTYERYEMELGQGKGTPFLRNLLKSIKDEGLRNPLIVCHIRGQIIVVWGNNRLVILRYLKYSGTVPCIFTDGKENESTILRYYPHLKNK